MSVAVDADDAVFAQLKVSLELHSVVGSPRLAGDQSAMETTLSHQPFPESLRAQLARLDAKRAVFAGQAAPVVESLPRSSMATGAPDDC